MDHHTDGVDVMMTLGDSKKHASRETSVAGGSGVVTPPNSDAGTTQTAAFCPLQNEEQQWRHNTPETPPPRQRRSTVGPGHCSGYGHGKNQSQASPRTRNTKAATTDASVATATSPNRSHRSHRSRPSTAEPPRTLEQIQAEHLYLVANLQQQEARIRMLVAVLANVQAQLQQGPSCTPLPPSEARRLRKNAGFIKSKIADAEQQERLALLGIGRVSAELQSRYRHVQLQQHMHVQQLHIASQMEMQMEMHPHPPTTPHLLPHSAQTAEHMSPMSPLAPVFQPGASYFYGRQSDADASSGGIDAVIAAADAAAAAATKEESLGGTTFAGEADDKADDEAEKDTATSHDEDGDSDGSDGYYASPTIRRRRGTHGEHEQEQKQKPLTPAQLKRRSLPPVQSCWAGNEV